MEESNQEEKTGAQAPVDPFNPDSFKTPDIMTAGQPAASPAPVAEVKLIVFDMGHVFVDFEWEEVCRGFYALSGHTRDEFRSVLHYVGGLGYERGEITTEDFLKELNARLGTTLSVDEFKVLWNATFRENPEMAALLQALKASYPLYLLSNTNEVHYRHLQDTYGVARHFQELILSYEVGHAKPDAAIYQVVLERSGLAAANCVFVDDLPGNVAAARALGMHGIQFTGIEALKSELQALGVKV